MLCAGPPYLFGAVILAATITLIAGLGADEQLRRAGTTSGRTR
jgi:hypothetical protein